MLDEAVDVTGWTVVDPSGDRIGKVVRRYPDAAAGPGWVLVSTGVLADDVLIPLQDVQTWDNQLAVRFYRSWVKDAPAALPNAAPEVLRRLLAHYRAVDPRVARPIEAEITAELPVADVVQTAGTVELPAADVVEAATEPQPAPPEVIRSAERLQVALVRKPVERVRIRKSVVVQPVTQVVPVVREDVVVERIPVDGQPADGDPPAPAEVSEAVHELVLHKEEAVVSKRVVPVERVRLRVVHVGEDVDVNTDLRSEQVEVVEPPA